MLVEMKPSTFFSVSTGRFLVIVVVLCLYGVLAAMSVFYQLGKRMGSVVERAVEVKVEEVEYDIPCHQNSFQERRTELRGPYWVLYNHIAAESEPKCNEMITYATQGEYQYLHNLLPLVDR